METEKKPAENAAEQTEKPQNIFARYWAWHKKRKAIAKEKEKNKTIPQKILSWVWTLLAAVVIAMALRMFVAEPIRVDGYSMTNTLQDGEIVLASKLAYLTGEPQRNDVVICRYPGRVNQIGSAINFSAVMALDFHTIFVKRLVALPGDYVMISGGHLYVNNELVPDPELMASIPENYPLRKLGDDEYFVIGDNRYSSHDSRASDVGPISRGAIMGKVTRVLLPFSAWRVVK